MGIRQIVRWFPLGLLTAVAGFFVVLVWRGGMFRILGWFGFQAALPALGALVGISVLSYAAWPGRWRRRIRSRAVLATLAASAVALLPLVSTLGIVPIRYPSSLEGTHPAATVRLPADVPLKVAWGGDRLKTNYHAKTPDQRWAYDLLVEPYLVGSDRLEDYGCYGIPVLAPASGTVTVAHDGEVDARPGVLAGMSVPPTGNHVAIRLDTTGTYLVLAHFKPGSVAVAVGDHVAEGQVVGLCGNSGNTSEPHIHIHHQRQDPAEVPVGFAEGLPLYFRDHDGEPMPEGGLEERDGKAVTVGATVRHVGPRL